MRLEGRAWPEAGRFASAAAALTTTAFGVDASLPRRDAVLTFLEQLEVGAQSPSSAKD